MTKLLLPLRAALLLTTLAALPGCGGPDSSATSAAATPATQARVLTDSLDAHHERAMGQMAQLFELKARLTALRQPAATAPVEAKLATAHQVMMDWMHHFQAPDSTQPAAQRLAYLQAQQQQLAGVERRLRGAIDSATATLHQLPAAGVTPAPAPAAH
ncbi:MAG: hypothetical protein EOO59_05265 [Hymenobacter sp.]|nr:MAG: hypothetical protein EOO59_05265 [Hymenobacter sp.]